MHLRLIALCSVIYIIFGTIKIKGITVDMNYVSWFIVLYFISSYIRLYEKKIFNNTRFWGYMMVISVGLSMISVVLCAWAGSLFGKQHPFFFVTDSNTFLAVMTGVSSFLFFKNLKIKNSKFVNTVAASTFGVLLIHANSDTMRSWLWQDVLHCVEMYNSSWLVLHAIASVLVIYISCTVIDYIYNCIVEKTILKMWDEHGMKVVSCFEKIEKTLYEKLNS